MKLNKKLKLDKIVAAPNLVEMMDTDDVKMIGQDVLEHYNRDESSRSGWKEKYKVGMELALQVVEHKSEPWDGASNVKFPLITVAALNFHARAYPALVDTDDLVKCMIWNDDADGKMTDQGNRIGRHMTWQNIEQDEGWEEETDKLLLSLPIVGTCFKKRYFDPFMRHQRSVCVLPQDLCVNYWTKGDINLGPRATYRLKMLPNDIHSRVVHGIFDGLEEGLKEQPGDNGDMTAEMVADRRQGLIKPADDDSNTPISFLEQLCWYDLDGDGYSEPYVATVELMTGRLRRLVARFLKSGIVKRGDKVEYIEPQRIYQKYELIPSPDGGYYGLGFGGLLGPINESVNSALNILFDSGTMCASSGGFLGRGAKFRGGDKLFKPWEWKTVDSTGDDLRKNLIQLPVRDPSTVLFQLLTFLVGYGERVASASEIQVGDGDGQNVKAGVAETLNENGARIYNAIYKRIWRADRDSYRMQFDLNRNFLVADRDYQMLINGPTKMIEATDYLPPITRIAIRPSADPTATSQQQAIANADFVFGMSLKVPGFNRYQSTLLSLRARKIRGINLVYPAPVDPKTGQPVPDYPAPPDPKMLEVQIKQQAGQLAAQKLQHDIESDQGELQMNMQLNQAKIVELQAQSNLQNSQAAALGQGHAVGAMQVQLQAAELRQKQMAERASQLQTAHESIAKLIDSHQQRQSDVQQRTADRAHEAMLTLTQHAHEKEMQANEPSASE